MAKGPTGQPGRRRAGLGGGGLANKGNHLTSTKVDAPGPPGEKRMASLAILTIASILHFFKRYILVRGKRLKLLVKMKFPDPCAAPRTDTRQHSPVTTLSPEAH